MKSLFVLLLLILSFSTCILGQEKTGNKKDSKSDSVKENPKPEEPVLVASPDARTAVVFPQNPTLDFTPGEIVELVLGFSNKGERLFNITHITASLRYLQDWKYYIQNFTKLTYGIGVLPEQEGSFLYTFRPDPLIEPRQFGMQVNVFYHDSANENFTSVLFNGTINIVEPNESFDTQTVFTYVGLLAVVGLIGFIVLKSLGTFEKKIRGRKSDYSTPKVANQLDNDWLEGTSASSFTKKGKSLPKPKKN